MKLPVKRHRIPEGTELIIPNSQRTGWKLVQYISDDIIVAEASDGKQIQVYVKNVQLRYSMNIRRAKK